ncbi:ISL3 family transposase [Curvibacter gracilis]|uniref:ISL3 family transposase n=1 Tax=Curvibacter gracilis TaxID=230310 RepID=UPI0004B295F5|nr:ISL3 family transposase [Curvibacter gracilis]
MQLDAVRKRIDFEVRCGAGLLACPACGAAAQKVHDRLRRSWRHLDFFQFEAWLHADLPRVVCSGCGKTTQLEVPWVRPSSGFTAAFEALALALCRELPVRQAAKLLHCADKPLWRRIEFYIAQARALESFAGVELIGIDKTSLRRGQRYISVVHDLQAKRLLLPARGAATRRCRTSWWISRRIVGDPAQVRHICMDMSAAYTKGAALALPQAAISYDRFHVVALAIEAMDAVRRQELQDEPQAVQRTLQAAGPKARRQLMWGMRKNPAGCSAAQWQSMHSLQRSGLKSARAWRLKMALREVYARARAHNDEAIARQELNAWLSWARRCRLAPMQQLAQTLKTRLAGIVRGMLDHRSNALVESINGLLQQAKRAAPGFRTAKHFIAVAYLRMSKLSNLPVNPMSPADAR